MPERPFNGFVFFSADAPPGYRRRRIGVAVLLLLAALALVWPVYPFFASIRPLILGLPLSFAWVVLWLCIVFAALVGLYRSEPEHS